MARTKSCPDSLSWCTACRRFLLYLAVLQLSGAEASLIAFGDSYSDTAQHGVNLIVPATLGTTQANSGFFPAPPYYQGRFSNGPIYLETAAASFGDVLNSYAAGAATVGAPGTASAILVYPPYDHLSHFVTVPVPNGLQQAAEFLHDNNGYARPQSTYILEFGVNDYLNLVGGAETVTTTAVVQTITQIIQTLYNAGARSFVVFNVPPFAGLPIFLPPYTPANMTAAAQALATNLTSAHNAALTSAVSNFNAGHAGANVQIYDFYSFFVNLVTNAAKEGFTASPLTQPCYSAPAFYPGFTAGFAYPVCSNPDQHIFWDAVHLTNHANNLLAADIVAHFPQLTGA